MPYLCDRVALTLLLPVILAAGPGCGRSARNCVPAPIASSSDWIDLSRDEPAPAPVVSERAGPRNVLILSSGGMYGAFGVGVLTGWPDRPTFDVVTGVSVGALAATYVFLGAGYDGELERLFTTVSDRDIYRRRGPLAPLRSDSVASSAPMKRLIETRITPDVLAHVAAAHREGRRLYVGTTNLDTRRLVVWDMGAIAARGDLGLYRDVILASASIPGFFPPVRIDVEVNGRAFTEVHADGGASAQLFLHRSMLGVDAAGKALRPTTVWVVVNGKLYADPGCTDARAIQIGTGAANSLIHAHTRNDLRRLSALTTAAGGRFRVTYLPQDFPVDRTDRQFDPEVMGKLFAIGQTMGKSGPKAWQSNAPEPDDEESAAPRTGTRFLAPEPARPAGAP